LSEPFLFVEHGRNTGAANMDGTTSEVFALTDEQILGMEPGEEVASGEWRVTSGQDAASKPGSLDSGLQNAQTSARDDNPAVGTKSGQEARTSDGEWREAQSVLQQEGQVARGVPQAPPQWLAERMRDPWHGDEAKELWEGAVQARQEAAAYREAIATPAEARALKEIYPGGVNEAKTAAERARQLEEFDAAYFGAAGKPAEAMSAARVQLAQRLMEQDPGAFREMVAAGVRLLEGRGKDGDQRPASGDQEEKSRSLRPEGLSYNARDDKSLPIRAAVQEVPAAYVSFEKAANAELEKSVGGTIARAIESALPNLKSLDRAGRDGAAQGTPLPERLGMAVREEVEAALKSDAQLGEQVARILGARRFDDAVRAQVVHVIDARAQQLVPGAVKRVVGSWTTATLGTRGKSPAAEAGAATRSEVKGNAAPRSGKSGQSAGRNEKAEARVPGRTASRGRVDYGKLSDEQILDMS
jgi:hypothetical protein